MKRRALTAHRAVLQLSRLPTVAKPASFSCVASSQFFLFMLGVVVGLLGFFLFEFVLVSL